MSFDNIEIRPYRVRDMDVAVHPFRYLGRMARDFVGGAVLIGGLTVLTYFGTKSLVNSIYSQKDFENLQWVQIDNKDGNIWDDFEKSGIPQNDMNRQLYISEVIKRNGNDLRGKIEVPINVSN